MKKLKNIFSNDFVFPLSLSIGIALLIRQVFFLIHSPSVLFIEYLCDIEFLITLISSLLIIWPFYVLTIKWKNSKISVLEIKNDISNINDKIGSIDIKVHTELDRNLNKLDYHRFNNKRHEKLIERIELLHNRKYKTNILKLSLNELISKWVIKGTDNDTDLHQLIYHHFVNNLVNSEGNSLYLMPLDTFLKFLLDILNIGLSENDEFHYYSFTNALPDSWFSVEEEDSPLDKYRIQVAKLLSIFKNNNNYLKRFVLTYKDIEQNSFKNISNRIVFNNSWKQLGDNDKKVYIDQFILNKNAYVVNLSKYFLFEKGFSEIIYIGGGSNGKPNWKWAIIGEYIPLSKSMIFQLYNFRKSTNDLVVAKIDVSLEKDLFIFNNSDSIPTKRCKISIGISNFPEIIEDCHYTIEGNKIVEYERL
jgi:hypothetical protein